MKTLFIVAHIVAASGGCLFYIDSSAQHIPQLGKATVKEVITAMTLEEKTKLVTGNGFTMPGAGGPVIGTTQDKVPGAAGTTFAIPRLGIPSIVVADGPAGVRISPIRNGDSSKTFYATAWPVGTLLASTWDTEMVRKVGTAFGHEVHEYGIDILLGPGLNIHRNPLGGRNFEYYSEDPVVAGNITAAMVNGIESNGVGTSIKHFAANNQETNRNSINTVISERALREIYLRPFEIAVKQSQPWTVMSSYNKINGTFTSEEYDLLTTILRKEWGFKGFVMTDWFGGKDPVAQMKAGNDLLMPGTKEQSAGLQSAVAQKSLDTKILDENIERILNIILQSPAFKGYPFSNKPDLAKDAVIARTAAAEGMVLLKNDSAALPLIKPKMLALFGNTSYDLIAGGTGSGDVNKAYIISLVQGLRNAGYQTDTVMQNRYTAYIIDAKAKRPKPRNFFDNPAPVAEMFLDAAAMDQEAARAEAAIITIGRNAGEGHDRTIDNDFNLSDAEQLLIKNVAAAFHAKNKKVIVVLNIGGVIEVNSWKKDADAILLAWQPGLEAGNAIADLISGKVNPSGKLATTFPVKYEDVPSAKNFPGKEFPTSEKATSPFAGKPSEVVYEEGIYIGYRYYNTFNIKPAFEFGYGLSYTKFAYSSLRLNTKTFNGAITITVTVTNTGTVAGKEIVQLYLAAPAGSLDKPAIELKRFAKTAYLQPGESQIVEFALRGKDLASFNTQRSAWIADAGNYVVKIGASSTDIKAVDNFKLPVETVIEKVSKVLPPTVQISELKK